MADPIDVLSHAMNNDLYRMSAISNNLANVNTAGYKREISVFSGFLGNAVSAGGVVGSGVFSEAREQVRDFGQGALKFTGNSFDIAINGDGFFSVMKGGEILATRTGKFTLDSSGKLTTFSGAEVQGQAGPIYLESESFLVHPDGRIEQGGEIVDHLRLVDFESLSDLDYRGEGLFELSSAASISMPEGIRVKQGYSESSNVNTASEMVKLIETTRHFESSHQVLKGYDGMLNSAVNILAEF